MSNTNSTNYSVGKNIPGYLPESDVWVTSDFDAAKRSLIEDLLRYADDVDDESDAEDLTHAAEDVNLWSGPGYLTAAGLAWWIDETDEDPDDDEALDPDMYHDLRVGNRD